MSRIKVKKVKLVHHIRCLM